MLVDDTELVLKGLAAMLEDCGERVEVVGSAFFDQDVSDAAEQAGVHIVLVDVELMGQEQLRGPIERLLQSASSFRTAIYTDRQEGSYLFEALRLGAAGYLLKSTPAQMLVNQLERIRAGEVVIHASLATRATLAATRVSDGQGWPGAEAGLTKRESEVLALLVEGQANRGIAESLFLSEETVKTHLRSIYRKLDVRDRSQAIATALRERMFP
ncbi:MAG: DNA-binding response regulator [Acidimicrobiales bacterium]|nr:MAG: DNA-binding response regulator [Acidimicrobiales bacterium]